MTNIVENTLKNLGMELIVKDENKGVIFISHRLSSAVVADRIYMLENGEIIETGTHRELMELDGKYADMFRKQAENYKEGGKE